MTDTEIPRDFQEEALELLRVYTDDVNAHFHQDQLETIYQLVERRERVFLVQRTGWGKSAVYFIATKLLRRRSYGPTLLVSPLLALMRDQIRGASSILNAETINSTNTGDWDIVEERALNDEIDILLISPERLANNSFRENLLPVLSRRVGLFVVDEAHCISNWGHDFRPDYQRIKNITSVLPAVVPLLACTATANQRVIDDVKEVMNIDTTIRGPLERKGLKLHAYKLDDPSERLAWLTRNIPFFNGAGIIYVLTIKDSNLVAEWLRDAGITAEHYSANLPDEQRVRIEEDLLNNRVQVVVATTALGMGFDHPSLKFVIHYQSPQSVIHYYQQVGRAGRQLKDSYGILLKGTEDDDINNYFIENAFPSEKDIRLVLGYIEERGHWVAQNEILSEINISGRSLEKALLHLEIQQAIERRVGEYRRTLNPWNYDALTVEEITSIRRAEVTEMKEYIETDECRNAFLLRALDDPNPTECGICQNCTGSDLDMFKDNVEIERAQSFVRSDYGIIAPRLQGVPSELRSSEGRVLSRWGVGIGSAVRSDREAGFYSDELLEFSERLIWDIWAPHPFPTWITVVPSNRYPGVLENFASRLAERLAINFLTAITKIESRPPQRNMQNTVQQRRNVQGCFEIREFEAEPVLLLDDIVDSRWTLTQIGMQLREAGVEKVYPFALADTSGSQVHD